MWPGEYLHINKNPFLTFTQCTNSQVLIHYWLHDWLAVIFPNLLETPFAKYLGFFTEFNIFYRDGITKEYIDSKSITKLYLPDMPENKSSFCPRKKLTTLSICKYKKSS